MPKLPYKQVVLILADIIETEPEEDHQYIHIDPGEYMEVPQIDDEWPFLLLGKCQICEKIYRYGMDKPYFKVRTHTNFICFDCIDRKDLDGE